VKNKARVSPDSEKLITKADSPNTSEMCCNSAGSSRLSPYHKSQRRPPKSMEKYPRLGSTGGPDVDTVKRSSVLLSTKPEIRASVPVADFKKACTGVRSESSLLINELHSDGEIWLMAATALANADASAIRRSGANQPLSLIVKSSN